MHTILVGIAVFVATSSIQAYEGHEDEFYGSLLYALIEHEDLGYLIEEKVDIESETADSSYLSTGKLLRSESPLTNETDIDELTDDVALTQGGTALVKPNISGDDEVLRGEDEVYLVDDGDTISSIAERFGVNVSTILWANNLSTTSYIKPGQTLLIPSQNGIYHLVAKGENLTSVAKKYGISPQEIIDFNQLASSEVIASGQKIFIPNGKKLQTIIPRSNTWDSVKKIFTPDKSPSVASGEYIWPTTCRRITQYYGWVHTGVDIACSMRTPVYASREGVVIKASNGWNGGYGNIVIIDHGNGVQTLYGHNTELYVTVGDQVAKGQVIANIGSTGRSTGPHSHFEVRVNGQRTNPLNYVK